MSFGVNFSKVAQNGKQLHISIAFKRSNMAAFGNCKNFTFIPLFPLVGRVGKNGFWYNKKSSLEAQKLPKYFAGKVVKHNRVNLSIKEVKCTEFITRALEEIARTKLVDIVSKRRNIKVETHNALKE